MNDLIVNSQISSITTVRDVEITFTKQGQEFTAEFSVTSTYDTNLGSTFSEPEILNQVELCEKMGDIYWSDEEEKEVWEAAKKEGQSRIDFTKIDSGAVFNPEQFKKLEAEFGSAI